MQAFYNGVTQAVRSTIDVAVGGTLMNRTEDEAYNLIDEMTLNNFQWSTKRVQPKWVVGKLEVDVLTLLSAKVDAMIQRLNQMNVNAVNSSATSPCEIWGSIEHVTFNCQVGSPFSQDPSEVNYVQNFDPRLVNDPYSSTYNLSWKNHLNFSYSSNPNSSNMPPMNARPPPGFQRPPFPSQVPQKSNLEAMIESVLMTQQKRMSILRN